MINKMGKSKSALIIVPEKDYNKTIATITKEISTQNVCYITLNKTCQSLSEILKKQKVHTKNIKFIDCISKSLQDVKDTKDCTFISSPEAITELSIVIGTHLKYDFDYIIIDSMTNMLTYTNADTIKKFMKSLIIKMNGKKCKLIIFALDLPEHQELLKSVSTFVETTIKK